MVGQTELAELIQKASEEERKEREGEARFFDRCLMCGNWGARALLVAFVVFVPACFCEVRAKLDRLCAVSRETSQVHTAPLCAIRICTNVVSSNYSTVLIWVIW